MLRWLQSLFSRKAERRNFVRVHSDDVRILIEDEDLELVDWSPGGFRVHGIASTSARGRRIAGEIYIANEPHGRFTAIIIRVFEDGSVSARFDEIAPDAFRALTELPQ